MHATHIPCKIDGCPRRGGGRGSGGGRGYCGTHYRRLQRHGDPMFGGEVIRQHSTGVQCEYCRKLAVARGMCENHYRRWKRCGDPLGGNTPHGIPAAIRFGWKTDKNGPIPEHRPDLGRCWIWTDAPNGSGYGTFGIDGMPIMAHRYSWVLAGNTLDPELTIDHLCRVRLCVNPAHLEQVTQAENLARAREANRERVGSGSPTV